MKKFMTMLAVAGLLVMSAQSAFAISKAEITYGDPTGHGVYLGDGMYMSKDRTADDGAAMGKEKIMDDAAFCAVKTIAIAPAKYSPQPKEPTWQETMQILDESKSIMSKDSGVTIIGYSEIAELILRECGEDITTMPRRQATAVFRKYVSRYADAYLEVTIANGGDKLDFFTDVIQSGTNTVIFNYSEAVAGYNGRNTNSYTAACKDVFKGIDQGRKTAKKNMDNKKMGIEWKID